MQSLAELTRRGAAAGRTRAPEPEPSNLTPLSEVSSESPSSELNSEAAAPAAGPSKRSTCRRGGSAGKQAAQ
jgi:hypothetical protein